MTAYPKTASEKGTVPFCSENCPKSTLSPAIFSQTRAQRDFGPNLLIQHEEANNRSKRDCPITNTATKWQLSRIHFEDERPGDVLEWNLTANPPDFEAPSYVFEPLSATQMVGWQPILAPGQFNG